MEDEVPFGHALTFMELLEGERAIAGCGEVEAENGHQCHERVRAYDAGEDGGEAHHEHAVEEELTPAAMGLATFGGGHGQRRHDKGDEAGELVDEKDGGHGGREDTPIDVGHIVTESHGYWSMRQETAEQAIPFRDPDRPRHFAAVQFVAYCSHISAIRSEM